MSTPQLFEQTEQLQQKFSSAFIHRKKLRALENYSTVAPFQHKNYLEILRQCMSAGFLDETESGFLGHMLKKYEVNFLDWAHRTMWLKGEMKRLNAHYNPPVLKQADLFEQKTFMPPMPKITPFDFNSTFTRDFYSRRAV